MTHRAANYTPSFNVSPRVMKMSHVKIGNKSNIGAYSAILYDAEVEEGARLLSLSLLMKGEAVPAHKTWQGIPCGLISSA